jgi:tetratricopeptide (TPR) repeat protein
MFPGGGGGGRPPGPIVRPTPGPRPIGPPDRWPGGGVFPGGGGGGRPPGPIVRPGGRPGDRPIINRPGDRPIINRPGGDNVVNRPIRGSDSFINRPTTGININRPGNSGLINTGHIGNTNIGISRQTTVNNLNRVTNVVNRPGGIGLRPGMPYYRAGALTAGAAYAGAYAGAATGYPVPVYPGVYDGGYAGAAYPVDNYAPMAGYGGGYYGQDYSSPYADFDNGWRRNFWGGFGDVAGTVLSGMAAVAASQPPTTVVYQNPYQAAPAVVAAPAATAADPPPVPRELDYSKPIEVPTAKEAASLDEEIVQLGMKTFEQARTEFTKGEYALAQGDAEKAIRLVPGDTTIHEVRALAQFAQKKYQDAAGTIYAVLSTAPGSSWDTLGALYPDPAVYQKQLKALEDSIREGGNEPWRHFLLAYHYMVLNEREAALEEFREAARLNDKDQVSPRMVALLEKALGKDPTKEGAKEAPKKEEK